MSTWGGGKLSTRVDKLLGDMSLEEKLGQVFIFTFVNQTQAILDLRLHPGGFVRIYSDALTVAKQHQELQLKCKLPLTISADFERGIGSTITGAVDVVSNMCMGASGDEQIAYDCGRVIAEEARVMGINMNYVPVLDVNINEKNPIINTRSFGADPELVARMGAAFIRGTKAGRVITCGKHFPGHGDTHVDSHSNLGVIEADRQRMEAVELVPFRRAIEAGVDSIMSAHLCIPAYDSDPVPATMSRRILHGLLREELGFEGVIVSDALEMGGITKHFPPDVAIVKAFNAGCDQLIMPTDNEYAISVLRDAVKSGAVSEARLNEAVGRLLTMKENAGLFEDTPLDLHGLAERLDTKEHQAVSLNAALSGITLMKGTDKTLPLRSDQRVAVITFSNSEDPRSYFLEPKTFGSHLATHLGQTKTVNCGLLDERMVHEFHVVDRSLAAAREADVIVLGVYVRVVINRGTVGLEPRYTEFLQKLLQLGKPLIVASFGSPYLLNDFSEADAFACGYSGTEATQQAMAMLLCGKAEFRGRFPDGKTSGGKN